MKIALLLLALIVAATATTMAPPQLLRKALQGHSGAASVQQLWHTQTLDHFTPSDKRSWKQRYWVDEQYYTPGGPIFVQFGEEGPMDASYVTGLQMANYGRAHNAMLVAIEHRFYGESKPLPDLSTPNLKYLSVIQALADFNAFIHEFKAAHNASDAKVVVFGCSYIGAGSAWFQMTYPDTAAGAVASSAPVQAVVDMVTYLEQVGTSISERFGASCDNALTSATAKIAEMVSNKQFAAIAEKFNVCPGAPLADPNNLFMFMQTVAGNVMGTVQYVNENPAVLNITGVCDIVLAAADPLSGLANLTAAFANHQCIDVSYADAIKEYQILDQSAPTAAMRSWTWQTCTEFGYYQSTDSKKQPFWPGNMMPVSKYLQMCNDIYGISFNVHENVAHTNARFHGNHIPPSALKNTVFDNSLLDPWHTLSIQSSVSPSVPLLLFGTEGHCAAIMPDKPNDPQSILDVRRAVASNIAKWLA